MQKGFANIVLIIILVLILGGAGYLILRQGAKKEISPAPLGEKEEAPVALPPSAALSCAPSDPPSITIISPNDGEIINLGQTMNVLWSSCNIGQGSVGIELIPAPATIPYPETYPLIWTYNDGTEQIILNIDLLGRQIPPGSYKLSISQPPETPPYVEDMSDNFFSIQ